MAWEISRKNVPAMLILLRVRLSNEKNPPKRHVPRPLEIGRAHSRSLTKPAVVPAFIQLRLEFRETEILPDLLRHWYIEF